MNINELRSKIKPYQMLFLITATLQRESELRAFVRKLGISYPGFRIESVSPDVLVNDIISDFYITDDVARDVIELLDNELISELDFEPAELPKFLKRKIKTCDDKKIAKYMWYLIRRGHEKFDYLMRVIENELKQREHIFGILQQIKQEEQIETLEKEKTTVVSDYEKLKHEFDKMKTEIEVLRREVIPLKQQLRDREEKLNICKKQIAELQRIISNQQEKLSTQTQTESKLLKEKEIEIQNLQSQLESLSNELKHRKFFDAKSMKRVGIFVDTENIYYTAKGLYNRVVNYESVVDKILLEPKRNYGLWSCISY